MGGAVGLVRVIERRGAVVVEQLVNAPTDPVVGASPAEVDALYGSAGQGHSSPRLRALAIDLSSNTGAEQPFFG